VSLRGSRLPPVLQKTVANSIVEAGQLSVLINQCFFREREAIAWLFCWKCARTTTEDCDSVLRGVPRDMAVYVAKIVLHGRFL
jgi:hypothetical protein